jgi:hypothetical protein
VSVIKTTLIPNFLTAGSPRALRRLMFLNNKRLSSFLEYQIQFVNGKWFAWYYEDALKPGQVIEEVKSGEAE